MMQKHCTMMSDVVGELSSSFGRRLSIGAIGFAEEDEFDVMRAMAETAREYGVKANFSLPSLSGEGLGTSISWLTTSMTETKDGAHCCGDDDTARGAHCAARQEK